MKWAGTYDRALRCTGGPTKGARALLAWLLEEYSDDGLTSGGIYNCRPVRGTSSTTSLHGEGRAVDGMIPATPGEPTPLGLDIVRRLGAAGDQLGVQTVIYARRIYSGKSPDGRHYGGIAPHWDHPHIELTRAAAATLTLARCRELLTRTTPISAPTASTSQEDDMPKLIRAATGKVAIIGAPGRQPFEHVSPSHLAALQRVHGEALEVNSREFDLTAEFYGSTERA